MRGRAAGWIGLWWDTLLTKMGSQRAKLRLAVRLYRRSLGTQATRLDLAIANANADTMLALRRARRHEVGRLRAVAATDLEKRSVDVR